MHSMQILFTISTVHVMPKYWLVVLGCACA